MLQFLQPIWLWAISGILVLLIIHLWNIKQGKVLKVGSIAFLQNSSKQYAKSFKVNEWLLLLLRCLLIILGSFLLAGPTWKKATITKEKGWLLIDKNGLTEGYNNYKPLIDSLNNNGFTFHYFDKNFTATTFSDAIKDTGLNADKKTINFWDLIEKLDNIAPNNLPIYLITNNQLKHFTGERPVIQNNIRWLTYLSKDSVTKHIAKSYLTYNDSIRLIVANSTPTATFFSSENVGSKVQSTNNYNVSNQNGKLLVELKGDSAVLVDTSTLNIIIYAGQNSNDATYLKAALNAIQSFTERKMQLQVVNDAQSITAKQNWLFWLSDQQLPINITAENIFTYAVGKENITNSWINILASNVDHPYIHLLKKIVPANVSATAQIIWQDGFGNTILSKETNKQSNIFNFYNRFNPSWSNLVWDNSFPTLMAEIVLNEDKKFITDDKRLIDEQQLQPIIKTSSSKIKNQINKNALDISNIVWICLFIVFFIERIVSFHTKKADA